MLVFSNLSVYRGGFKNSKIEGIGFFISSDEMVKYTGEWKEGKPWGEGE